MYGEDRVFSFLQKPKIAAQLDADTKTAIANQVLRLDDWTLYNRKQIKGLAGIQDLFLGGDTEEQGIRNFNNGKLPKFEHFVIGAVKIGVVGSSSSSDPAHVANYTSQRSSFPAALANGKLVVEQNDKPLLELEVFEATTQTTSNQAAGNADVFPLKQLRLLRADVPFKWRIKFADGETVLASTTYLHLEVALLGWKTKLD